MPVPKSLFLYPLAPPIQMRNSLDFYLLADSSPYHNSIFYAQLLSNRLFSLTYSFLPTITHFSSLSLNTYFLSIHQRSPKNPTHSFIHLFPQNISPFTLSQTRRSQKHHTPSLTETEVIRLLIKIRKHLLIKISFIIYIRIYSSIGCNYKRAYFIC